jgi:accessory gene regulator B
MIIEKISEKLSDKLMTSAVTGNRNPDEFKERTLVAVTNTSIFLTTLLGGFIVNHVFESFLCLFVLACLRYFSGGMHMWSMTSCFLFTSTVALVIPSIHVSTGILIGVGFVSAALIAVYAPLGIRRKINSRTLKLISVFIVTLGLLSLNTTVILSLFVQSLTVIKLEAKKEVNSQ